jgi:putative ATP-dependent endonuclease of OLD family
VFAREQRQFAEAILARAVLVVEGATEMAVFLAGSTVMEKDLGPEAYTHFDLAGVTVFDAGSDGSVPQYGGLFTALGKQAFCFYDKPNAPLSAEATIKLAMYTQVWESPEKGMEALLVKETSEAVLRRFLIAVKDRPDYPSSLGIVSNSMTEAELAALARKVLQARKGTNYPYANLLISQCQNCNELPATILNVLTTINSLASPSTETPGAVDEGPSAGALEAEM